MKTAKGIKTVRVVTETKVFNDFGNLVNAVNIFVITRLDKNNTSGFILAFRTYSETFENGGFETTLWISNCEMKNAEMFLGTVENAKRIASTMNAGIDSFKINNKLK